MCKGLELCKRHSMFRFPSWMITINCIDGKNLMNKKKKVNIKKKITEQMYSDNRNNWKIFLLRFENKLTTGICVLIYKDFVGNILN